jgi:long-chain acyl-CoA synthetase
MANLTDAVARHAREAPGAVLFSRRREERWEDVTAARFHQEVLALAKGLVAAGIQPGDRVALLSPTRYEWTLADYAIWFAGAVGVPIYETSSAEQVAWILGDSGAVACVAGTAALAATVESVRERAPDLRLLWTIDAGDLDRLAAEGGGVADAEIARRREQMSGETVATLIYTSGTTGRPKGCELTHGNFVDLAANARAALSEVLDAPGACTLLFLPLAHVFARFIQVVCVVARARIGHTSDVRNLLPALAEFRPTFLLAVPRVFEKIYNSAEARAAGSGKGGVFRRATETAVGFSEARDAGGPSLLLRVRHAVFDRLVFARLRAATGGRVTCAVSGGAPLGARLGHYFRGAGITIYEGWGLTETTAPATVNTPRNLRIGTVGQPLPGVAVRVDGDGELLVRGINVMRGYHNNPEATAGSLEGEWFHTGDLGEIDADGFVRITGRKKEIIVTAAGKNVAPMVLEDRLRSHPLISQAMVVGDQRPFIAALITLDTEMLPTWLANNGRPPLDLEAAITDEAVLAEVGRAVDDANTLVSRAESIRTFRILDTDFTEASGHLTPKLSIKRHAVMKDFAEEIDAIYS